MALDGRRRRPGKPKPDERDRDALSKAKSIPTAADREVERNRPAHAASKAGKLIDPGR